MLVWCWRYISQLPPNPTCATNNTGIAHEVILLMAAPSRIRCYKPGISIEMLHLTSSRSSTSRAKSSHS